MLVIKKKTKTRNLDYYQRKVVEMGIQYCRGVVKARNRENPLPEPVQVMVGGGAGSGKSEVIRVLAQWCQLILQKSGDDPDCPYVVLAAPTGTAAANIRPQSQPRIRALAQGLAPSSFVCSRSASPKQPVCIFSPFAH